ncbi:MAG: hypothetical protein AABW91_00275 [Nanoarchaeota archaeon]
MNILFVCRHNRFRSKVAEAVFNKINKESRYKAKSAGIIKGVPVAAIVKKIAKENGFSIKGNPTSLSEELMSWADIFVIVADDVPVSIFERYKKYGKKVIVWKIKDVSQTDEKSISKIFLEIKKKVEIFERGLDKKRK